MEELFSVSGQCRKYLHLWEQSTWAAGIGRQYCRKTHSTESQQHPSNCFSLFFKHSTLLFACCGLGRESVGLWVFGSGAHISEDSGHSWRKRNLQMYFKGTKQTIDGQSQIFQAFAKCQQTTSQTENHRRSDWHGRLVIKAERHS